MASIRQVIPIVVSIQITIAVGITGWISFKGGESSVQKLTKELTQSLTHRLELKINTYMSEAATINKSIEIALTEGIVNPNNILEVQKDLFNRSKELNKENTIYYGNESGTFAGLERFPDGKYQLRMREEANSPNRQNYELGSNGVRGKFLFNETYDHRSRPWYVAAKAAAKPIWTLYLSVPEYELATAKATPIYNDKGDFQGALGVNVPLKQIKQFMLQNRPSEQWNVFLVDGNGSLVSATSEFPILERNGNDFKRFELSQTKDPKLQAAGIALQKQFGGFQNIQNSQPVEFEFNGETYIVNTQKLDKGLDLDWSVGCVVPKSIFMKEIDANNLFNLVVVVIVLFINVAIALVVSGWLLRPIKGLMTAAQEIEADAFNPEELDAIALRDDELGQMARVFQGMGSAVADRQEGLKGQLEKLRKEKEEASKLASDPRFGKNNSLQSILSRARAAREQ